MECDNCRRLKFEIAELKQQIESYDNYFRKQRKDAANILENWGKPTIKIPRKPVSNKEVEY